MSITGAAGINKPTTIYEPSVKNSTTKGESNDRFKDIVEESVVDQFKRRRPDSARHVDQQVRAGKAVREKHGLSHADTANMTMEEYQAYFYALLDTIPYDSTRVNDTTVISISDSGWEQMRKDPDYEAWILGYFVEDRSVRNPFFGWGNNAGSMISERFGASIEEHIGQGFSKAALDGNSDEDNDDDKEDWWIKRHKRMKKLMKEQVEKAVKRDIAQKSAAQKEYARQQYISSQKQHSFLTSGGKDTDPGMTAAPEAGAAAAAMAAAAYINTIDLFGGGMGGDVR